MKLKCQILDASGMGRTLVRIAHEITERNENCDNLCIIGIKTRGIPMAQRLSKKIEDITGTKVPTGIIDISLYRDDLSALNTNPIINETDIPFDINGKTVILADDVIYTGRTVRAALDAVMQKGRPSNIQLAVMIDRGHRELPIRADYVGKNIPTSKSEVISVNFTETDGRDNIEIYSRR